MTILRRNAGLANTNKMPWWEYDATPFWLSYLHHPTTLERLCTFPFVGKG